MCCGGVREWVLTYVVCMFLHMKRERALTGNVAQAGQVDGV
jgi:hypothetical protein